MSEVTCIAILLYLELGIADRLHFVCDSLVRILQLTTVGPDIPLMLLVSKGLVPDEV